MAKVQITIEDGPDGTSVSWRTDGGFLHPDGSQAEQIAYYTLTLLAEVGGTKVPAVTAEGDGN